MPLQLDRSTAEELNRILINVRAGTETASERRLLIRIINAIAPEEMELFVRRHGIASVDALKRHVRERDNQELINGLVIIGTALLTAYLLFRRKHS